MNAEQKQRAAELLAAWRATAYALHADRMADLLQELVAAQEAEPVARVTGYYAGYLSIATVDGRVLPTGTALYTAPPAPSVPDVARDAARYRWLLNQAWFQQAADRFDFTDGGMQIRFEKCMDEFIDAAMSEKGQS